MSRPLRNLKDGRIAIVCEGSETEAPFLRGVRSLLEKSGKVTMGSIVIFPKIEQAAANPEATLQTQKTGDVSQWRYYYTAESNQRDYNQYRSQPTRYVREAQLLMEQEGYHSAWAVFDNDSFAHLKDAFDLVDQQRQKGQNLFVAFSSISIEECFLLSMEKCNKSFDSSVEVIDYMKAHGYIKDNYEKGDAWAVFGGLIMDKDSGLLRNRIFYNCTWSQQLEHTKPIYERNPYSDFERLIQFLTKDAREIRWIHSGEEFDMDKNRLLVEDKGNKYQITNVSGSHMVLNNKICGYTDDNLSMQPALAQGVILNVGDSIEINKQAVGKLCFLFGAKRYIVY